MSKKLIFSFLFLFSFFILVADNYKKCPVTIVKKGVYYEVVIDYTSGLSHYQLGRLYGKQLKRVYPYFEMEIDHFLMETAVILRQTEEQLFERAMLMKAQIPLQYCQEIEGIATVFTGKKDNMGDGKLTENEFYAYNLLIELLGVPSCSAISVYGSRSASGNTIIGRNYDWFAGISIRDLGNSVTFLKYHDKTICDVSWLGFVGIHTGMTSDGVYAGYTWSGTGVPYDALGKHSIVMSIRSALEKNVSFDGVAQYLGDENRIYAFNNNVLIADQTKSMVLENNFSSPDTTTIRRELRTFDSVLHDGVEWGFDQSVCVVNSFLLKGNHNNHCGNITNEIRWDNFKKMTAKKDKLDFNDVKAIMAYIDPYDSWGDIYKMRPNIWAGDFFPTMQIIVYDMKTKQLECHFQKTSIPDLVPRYKKIKVRF